ncbi:Pex19-domain-containing protein [Aaosphaeria arxii CBS 175.79]|uniref:Pex19-domain-containing protein n=1 Tax=Aaosphaeria arxii CBS 175.79 TaxID=1450172 RepID=A0A6A5XL63_9PLEO|nr:Pex19-domain-containing protein [Aaosphaeria arxii CBS 175.79]KAF2013683.1 Pex19-domain-containing protein [Aaosphaeria arxii CBS 175.79]
MADEPAKKEVPLKQEEAPKAEIASDPEEDDLSDLDDVLEEFANTKLDSKPKVPASASASTAAPSLPTTGPARPDPEDLLAAGDDDEFAKQLQAEMEQLLGQKDFAKQFEEIMKEMGEAGPGTMADAEIGEGSATPGTSAKADQNFQETIRRTMERMQNSGDQASAAAASSDGDDILAQMLKEMESGGFGGEGNDEDFSKVLMGMMEQLTNKEVLYEPMKELDDKFPKWMEDNKDKVSAEDLKRYQEQQTLVKEITDRFDRPGYSDNNAQDREYIVERMQKMQAAGSPPPDLVGDMSAAQEALGEIDQGCPTQ